MKDQIKSNEGLHLPSPVTNSAQQSNMGGACRPLQTDGTPNQLSDNRIASVPDDQTGHIEEAEPVVETETEGGATEKKIESIVETNNSREIDPELEAALGAEAGPSTGVKVEEEEDVIYSTESCWARIQIVPTADGKSLHVSVRVTDGTTSEYWFHTPEVLIKGRGLKFETQQMTGAAALADLHAQKQNVES